MKAKPVILVVDDQPENIELLEIYLVPQGYEILKAANGEEALEKLSAHPIDLILLDVMMPGMDGFEVTRRVRQDNTHRLLPIILITVLRESEDRVKGIEAGCDDFIPTPVDRMELLARVRSLLKVKAYNDLMSNYQKELESEVTRRTEELKHALENLQQDITERKRAEEQLRQSEELFRLIAENATDLIAVLDLEGKRIYSSPSYKSILGDPESLRGTDSFQEIHPEDHEKIRRIFLETVRTGIGQRAEYRFLLEESSVRYIESQGSVIRDENGNTNKVVVVSRDVTERKRAEEAIRESEERFRMVFENVFDGISIYSEDPDPLKRRLIECNERYASMAGRSREELLHLGSTLELQIMLEDNANDKRLKSLAGGREYKSSFSWIRPDGKENIVEYVGVPITWRGKSHTIGIDRDITERKRTETAIQEKVAELQRWQDIMLDRQDRTQELKREVNKLCHRAGEIPRYPSQEDGLVDSEAGRPTS